MRSGTAQSFLETSGSTSPLLAKLQHDISGPTPAESGPCSCDCHCGKVLRGNHRDQKRSRSQTNLRTGIEELPAWDSDLSPPEPVAKAAKANCPGGSSLEELPIEVLGTFSD